MAIVIEQEHKETNWIGIITTGIIVVIMFVGAYYLFFTQPELLSDIGVPPTVQKLSKIVELPKVSPTEVIGTSNFSQLKDFSIPITLPPTGKSNPFAPF
jgi:multidrug efflux pump subunit AcrA (membrane-fusion protein)